MAHSFAERLVDPDHRKRAVAVVAKLLRGVPPADIPIEITFNKDAKGVVTGLTMEREGRPAQVGKKVK